MAKDKNIIISIKTLLDNGLSKAIQGYQKLSSAVHSVGAKGRIAFGILKSGINATLAPLKVFTAVMAGGGGILTAFAASSIKAAGEMEMLRTQLRAVLATKKEADQAFAESIEFSVKTPFEPKEIIATRVALEGVGVEGQGAVEAVASAAAALNRDILEVAAAVKSMETEPLRNLGIMLKKDGEKFVIDYKDKMKQARQVTATGFAEAQQALLGVLLEKFDGGLEAMSATFQGKISTLKGAIDQFKADFGDGFMPSVKRIVDDLIGFFTGNTIASWGARLNGYIQEGWISLRAGVQTAIDAAAAIREHLASEGEGFGRILNSFLINGIKSFTDTFVASLKASVAIWKLFGTIVAGSIKEALLKTDLPGMGGIRFRSAMKAAEGLSEDQASEYLKRSGVNVDSYRKMNPNRSSADILQAALSQSQIPENIMTEIATSIDGAATEQAFSDFRKSLYQEGRVLKKKLSKNAETMGDAISSVTGNEFDTKKEYERNKRRIGQQSLSDEYAAGKGAMVEGLPKATSGFKPTPDLAEVERNQARRKLGEAYNENSKDIQRGRNEVAAAALYGTKEDLQAAQGRLQQDQDEAAEIKRLATELKNATASTQAGTIEAIQLLVNMQRQQAAQIAQLASQIKNSRS